MEESVLDIGIGQMGPGSALSIALGGYHDVLSRRNREKLHAALANFRSALDLLLEVGLVGQDQASRAWGLIRTEIGFESTARTCSYVVEAIAEDLAAKRELLLNCSCWHLLALC
jgi:3-hydroxyacyl-CoA dehydrogenase